MTNAERNLIGRVKACLGRLQRLAPVVVRNPRSR